MRCVSVEKANRDEEPESPDFNASLIHQKLQILNVCIHRSPFHSPIHVACVSNDRLVRKRRTKSVDQTAVEENFVDVRGSPEENSTDVGSQDNPGIKPRGVAGVLAGAFLEHHPDTPINIPITQVRRPSLTLPEANRTDCCDQLMPVHTSDSLMEEATLLSALHDSPDDRERAAKEQAKVLLSDMAAFKAANPEAQLSDFIKWHSPKDWVKRENGEGCLSVRMSHEADNQWMRYWSEVEACPAIEQIPLFDPALAGERALYSLETMEPVKLFTQLFQIGLLACFGSLQRGLSAKLPSIQHQSGLFRKDLKEKIPHLEDQPECATELLDAFKVCPVRIRNLLWYRMWSLGTGERRRGG